VSARIGDGLRVVLLFGALLATATIAACGDDGGGDDGMTGDPGGAGAGGAAGAGGEAGTGGDGAGAGGAGAAAGNGGGAAGNAGADAGGAGADAGTGDSGAGGESGFTEVGVCGQRGEATVNASSFTGFEEFYIIGERGFGEDICVVRFDVMRVGEAPEGCDDPTADVDCLWTHLVEFSNPSVVLDTDGVCADSQLGLGPDAIAEIEGSQAAYGFVSEFAGHNSVLMKYDEELAAWDAYGNGTWDEDAESFRFDRRDGTCEY
jgi:hypothetical protein